MSNLFENELYYVIPVRDEEGVKSNGGVYYDVYAVVNKDTAHVELKMPQLPEAISGAEQLAVAMIDKPWAWIRAQSGVGDEVNPDGSPVESSREPGGDDEVH